MPAVGTGVGMPWAVVTAVVGGCTRVPAEDVVWDWLGTGVGGAEVEVAFGMTEASTTRGVAPVVTVAAAEEPVVVVVEDEGVAMSYSSQAGRVEGVSRRAVFFE